MEVNDLGYDDSDDLEDPFEGVDDENNKYAFFPVKYPMLASYANTQQRMFWLPGDIKCENERVDFDKLIPSDQEYITFLLCLFAQLDGLVNENLVKNFQDETSEWKECTMFYAIQNAIEWIHNETYSLLIKAIIRDPSHQLKCLNAISHYPAIKKIALWSKKWMDKKIPLPERVVAFACIEGIIFSSAFAGIYWIKRRNIFPGLTKANELISKDEALHTEFAVALYHFLTGIINRFPLVSKERIHYIISSAVDVTAEFTKTAMKSDSVGLSSDSLIDYVKCTADALCDSLGYEKIYGVESPFDWMVMISLPNKSNFFETRPTEYKRQKKMDLVFDMDAAY